MLTRITDETLSIIENDNSIQPIAMHDFCDRYYIDIRSGLIYDLVDLVEITPTLVNDNLVVSLITNKGKEVGMKLGDILIRMIYGYTNTSFRPNLTEFPCDTSTLMPEYDRWIRLDKRKIEINGIVYYRWLDSDYYVSSYGTIWSVPYGAFLRHYYSDRGYCVFRTKTNGIGRSYRVHRFVWESHNGPIPTDKEIDHINDKRWDNVISNLQLLTHTQNLQKMNCVNYPTPSDDEIVSIARDIVNGMSTKDIAKKYSISKEKICDIKFRHFYSDIISAAGIDLSQIRRNRNSTPYQAIEEIKQLRNNGIPVSQIAKMYNINRVTVYSVLKDDKGTKIA